MNAKSLLVLAAATLGGVATTYLLREIRADRAAPERQPAGTPVEQSAAADDPPPLFKVLDVDRVGDVSVPKDAGPSRFAPIQKLSLEVLL